MKQKIEISYRTILFTLFSLIALWFIYSIRGIIVLTFFSSLLAIAINPLVDKIQKLKIPRVLAIFIVYALLISLFSVLVSVIVPALIEQTTVLVENFSVPFSDLPFLQQLDWQVLSGQLELVSRNLVNVLRILMSAASNVATIITLLILTFYFTYEMKNIDQYLDYLFVGERRAQASQLIQEIKDILGSWIRGQLLLMVIIGTMSYVGLLLLGVTHALPLAIIAGLLEFIPNLGPTLALLPAALVGWSISPITGVGTIILYIIIQQLENYLIVPQVMKKTVGLHPLISLLALLIGGRLYGVVGVLLAIPVFLLIKTVVKAKYFSSQPGNSGGL